MGIRAEVGFASLLTIKPRVNTVSWYFYPMHRLRLVFKPEMKRLPSFI